VGTGTDISIMDLAKMVGQVTGFEGKISNDPSKPDGAMRKLMDVSRLADMGWTAKVALHEGVSETYQWFLDNQDAFRR
jgi:GDP-L-fucose synthase